MKRWITPLVHPASILRGRHHLEPAQVAYLKRVAACPNPEPVDVGLPPPRCNPDPSLADLRDFTKLVRGFYQTVSFDIENAGPHLVCCGVVGMFPDTLAPGDGACFRFRRKGGDPWWPRWDEHLEVVTLLDSILGDPEVTKTGHFICQHDLPLLRHLGFEIRGRIIDTSALLHATHAELPKALQFAATLFVGAPRWKNIADLKDLEDNLDDE